MYSCFWKAIFFQYSCSQCCLLIRKVHNNARFIVDTITFLISPSNRDSIHKNISRKKVFTLITTTLPFLLLISCLKKYYCVDQRSKIQHNCYFATMQEYECIMISYMDNFSSTLLTNILLLARFHNGDILFRLWGCKFASNT